MPFLAVILAILFFLARLDAATASPATASPAAAAEDAGGDILDRYFEASKKQQEYLRDLSMDAEFEASVPSLKKSSKLHALRYISKIGKITYKVLSSQGDTGVKKDVIVRFIDLEMRSPETASNIGINRDNYRFKYRGEHGQGHWRLHLFELNPKRKQQGLFRGWLWVEARTGVPVREQGELVKSPSIWLRKIRFIRDYEMRGATSVPATIATTIDTRVVGTAELTIHFTNVRKGESTPQDDARVAGLSGLGAAGQ